MNVVSVGVPFYDSLKFALTKHDERNHSEAVKIYSELVEKGSQLACFNLGNCYLFGVGVRKDRKKGLELFGKCGGVKNDDLDWMRKLSNCMFVCNKNLDLGSLLYITSSLFHSPFFLQTIALVIMVPLHWLMH